MRVRLARPIFLGATLDGSLRKGLCVELQDAVAISLLPGVSPARLSEFLRISAAEASEATPAGILIRSGCSPNDAARIAAACVARARHLLDGAAANRIDALTWFDPRYPAALSAIFDPPPILWARGQTSALSRPAVAIVGSRAASAYALEVARALASELAERNVVVVSGLARGVDSAAHRGALDVNGATVAVLGSGIDVIYPGEHRTLAEDLSRDGVILSEQPPGTPPRPHHFPLRNRIISGLSRAIVVIEASDHSGSLITARCGLDQGREVMAVPGSVLTGRNRGGHALLKDGAKIVEGVDDILEELGEAFAGAVRPVGLVRPDDVPGDPVLERMVPGEEYEIDDLVRLTGSDAGWLLSKVSCLELTDQVRRTSSGRIVRPCGK